MFKKYYEDCKVGDRVTTPGRTVTEADVVMFAAFSGDWNSVHTDKEYAARYTPFGGRIAHGLLGLVVGTCLLSRLGWFTHWPQSTICITGLDNVRFIAPIKIGDTIYLKSEIIEKTEMSPETGLINTRLQIKNQHDKKVISGRLKLQAGRKPTVRLSNVPNNGQTS